MGRLSYFSTSDMELKMKDPKFGDRLGVLLLKKGMTQGELAKKRIVQNQQYQNT